MIIVNCKLTMTTEYNGFQDSRIKTVEECIATLNHNSTDMRIKLAKITTDIGWLKKSYWIIFTASVGGLITTIIGILIKR